MSHHRLIRLKDKVDHKMDPKLQVMDIHNFEQRKINNHSGDQIGHKVHGVYQKDHHSHRSEPEKEPEKAPEPQKEPEPSKWQEFKDSAKHTAKEYVKHKAIDASLEYGVKPVARWAGQKVIDYVLGGIADSMMNFGE